MTRPDTSHSTTLLIDEPAPATAGDAGRGTPISRLPLAPRDALPGPLRKQLDQLESQLGHLPN